MTTRQTYLYASFFALIIVLANYTVQFPINEWLTYGAIMYPFSFLITDVLSERYNKAQTLKVVRIGVVLAIIPTLLVADGRIAFASIVTFFLIQQLDVVIFHVLKARFSSLWWLRNNGSTLTSQFFDTSLFFILAFAGTMPADVLVKLIIGDYLVKVVLALLDTPFFYLFAIKLQNRKISQV
jgi:uncharacterized PurR-regulated membrane protein YhhQ (DUF165 family)